MNSGNKGARRSIDFLLIISGIFLTAFGLKGFLLPVHFIDGGVTGVSMLLSKLLSTPLAILIPIINFPFVLIGFHQMGLKFSVKSALAISGLSICVAFVNFPDVTSDKLLTAVFGGFLSGRVSALQCEVALF